MIDESFLELSTLGIQIWLIWFQALYHVLPMKYVTIAKLQNKLEGEANQSTVRKLIDKMTRECYLEAKGNRRLGVFPNKSHFCLYFEDQIIADVFVTRPMLL